MKRERFFAGARVEEEKGSRTPQNPFRGRQALGRKPLLSEGIPRLRYAEPTSAARSPSSGGSPSARIAQTRAGPSC